MAAAPSCARISDHACLGASGTRPGFLDNPRVVDWFGGVEPAWTALTYKSFNALQQEPPATNTALRLANDLTVSEVNASAVARNSLHLLREAARGGGLKLTATDNLARAVVAEMIDLFDWPDFDKTELFRLNKVINEPDFPPRHFVRLVTETAQLVRRHRGFLKRLQAIDMAAATSFESPHCSTDSCSSMSKPSARRRR
jgi:hypothetical protein